jgi:hypothetical protein
MPTYEEALTAEALIRGRGIRHRFITPNPDTGDETRVRASNWNDEHFIEPVPVRLIGTGTSITNPLVITKPDGVAAGDLLIAVGQFTNSTPDAAGPESGGWTNAVHYDTSSSEWQEIWYRTATGAEPSTWSWPHSSGTDSVGAVLVYRGIQTLYNHAFSGDSTITLSILSSLDGHQVCVWLSTTGSTPSTDFTIPAHLTQDLYVRNTGSSNRPQILVGSRGCPVDGACASFYASGGVGSYNGAWVGIFTP